MSNIAHKLPPHEKPQTDSSSQRFDDANLGKRIGFVIYVQGAVQDRVSEATFNDPSRTPHRWTYFHRNRLYVQEGVSRNIANFDLCLMANRKCLFQSPNIYGHTLVVKTQSTKTSSLRRS